MRKRWGSRVRRSLDWKHTQREYQQRMQRLLNWIAVSALLCFIAQLARLLYALSAQVCVVCVRLCESVREILRESAKYTKQNERRRAACALSTVLLSALSLSCCPMSVQYSLCVCVNVCVYTWWRETGLKTFLACYFFIQRCRQTYVHTFIICTYVYCLYA